jgi:hypothetical protein
MGILLSGKDEKYLTETKAAAVDSGLFPIS